jgi:hypothetical protein
MTYNNWYINNITPKQLDKLKKSRAAYAELDNKRLSRLLDEMAYVLDLLVDGPSDNRVWFKVKEVLDEYEQYRRDSKMVDVPNEPS